MLLKDLLPLIDLLNTVSITLTCLFEVGSPRRMFFLLKIWVIIDEKNDPLSFKSLVNNFHFINQSNKWTLNNGGLDFRLFYSDSLHLVENLFENVKVGKSIFKAIDSLITCSRSIYGYKNAVCSTDINLNQGDFPTLLCIVPVCDSSCYLDTASFVKSISKVVSTSSVFQVNPLAIVMFLQVNPLVLALFEQVKPLVKETSVRVKLSVLVLLVQANPFVIIMLVWVNLLVLVFFVQANLLLLVLFF